LPNPKKILVVAESIDVEDSSGSKGRVALIKNLSRIGYDVRVYHYTRKEINLPGIECFSIEEKKWNILFLLSRVERKLRYIFKIYLNKPLEKIFGFSFTLLNDRNSIIDALQNVDFIPDLVITVSKGGSFRPHHALLRLPEYHDKWLAYIHDPYPMHWYPPPYPWFEPGFKQKENFMKQVGLKCHVAGFPSKLLLEWMGGKFKSFHDKGLVIPHQLDDYEVFSWKNDLKNDHLSVEINPANFNIIHAGNLIQGREPYGLLKGFKKFLDSNPDAKNTARLFFLGGENYYSEVLRDHQKSTDQIVLSNSKLSFPETQKLQEIASVNIILEAKSSISPFLPGKFPHCVHANKKILLLGPPKSESRRLLGEDYPYWAEIDDSNRISYLIKELYLVWKKNPEELNLKRRDLEEYLSTAQLKRTFDRIIGI